MDSLQQAESLRQPARRNLPPSEVDCRWWKKGNCRRGSTCFFRHDPDQAGVDSPERKAKAAEEARRRAAEAEGSESGTQSVGLQCAICFEIPEKYGLLINCDHVFCLECIRSWRTSAKNTSQNDYLDPMSENNHTLKKTSKTCPMCRVQSDYVVPSTTFPSPPSPDPSTTADIPSSSEEKQPAKNPAKEEIINTYLSRLRSIPCRYFEQSVQRKREGMRNARLNCGFGNNCHYAHINPDTKEPYIFSQEELNTMKAGHARKKRRDRDRMAQQEMAFIVSGLAPLSLEDVYSDIDEDEYFGIGPADDFGDQPNFDILSDFFGPSPFFSSLVNRDYGQVFPPTGETDWETETDDDGDDDDYNDTGV